MATSPNEGLPFLEKKYRRLLFYSRFVLLYQLAYYEQDGITYGLLKDTKKLGIPLGSLSPNLAWLRIEGYAEEKPMNDGKESVYYITKEGKIAFGRLQRWLREIFIGMDKRGFEKYLSEGKHANTK
jgi:DNA-binding PadR family transcriptional regulator